MMVICMTLYSANKSSNVLIRVYVLAKVTSFLKGEKKNIKLCSLKQYFQPKKFLRLVIKNKWLGIFSNLKPSIYWGNAFHPTVFMLEHD